MSTLTDVSLTLWSPDLNESELSGSERNLAFMLSGNASTSDTADPVNFVEHSP